MGMPTFEYITFECDECGCEREEDRPAEEVTVALGNGEVEKMVVINITNPPSGWEVVDGDRLLCDDCLEEEDD